MMSALMSIMENIWDDRTKWSWQAEREEEGGKSLMTLQNEKTNKREEENLS